MMRTFTKWFFISWILQLIIVPTSMLLRIGEILLIPYWMLAYVVAISLGLPEKGILSLLVGFGFAAAIFSLLFSFVVVGIKYLKQSLC